MIWLILYAILAWLYWLIFLICPWVEGRLS